VLRTDFPGNLADTLTVGEIAQTVKANTLNRVGAIRSADAGFSLPRGTNTDVCSSGLLGVKIEESKTRRVTLGGQRSQLVHGKRQTSPVRKRARAVLFFSSCHGGSHRTANCGNEQPDFRGIGTSAPQPDRVRGMVGSPNGTGGGIQFTSAESKPGGARPTFTSLVVRFAHCSAAMHPGWARIFLISSESWITAITFISEPQRGWSETFGFLLAHASRDTQTDLLHRPSPVAAPMLVCTRRNPSPPLRITARIPDCLLRWSLDHVAAANRREPDG